MKLYEFMWDGFTFRFDASMFIKDTENMLDTAIQFYLMYQSLDPKGVGYLNVIEDINAPNYVWEEWRNEFGETLSEMIQKGLELSEEFENAAEEVE